MTHRWTKLQKVRTKALLGKKQIYSTILEGLRLFNSMAFSFQQQKVSSPLNWMKELSVKEMSVVGAKWLLIIGMKWPWNEMFECLLEWRFRETRQKPSFAVWQLLCWSLYFRNIWTSPRWIIPCFFNRTLNWRMGSLILVWFQTFTTVSSTTYNTTGEYNSLWRWPA